MNKTTTVKDYHERINKVLEYINSHLDEKLDLNILADYSNFSPFHFHRIMRAYLNDSIGNYIIRVRLETAARLLRFGKDPIGDIAFAVGYENIAGFSKAFKKRFGMSPAVFRISKGKMNILPENVEPLIIKDMELKEKISAEKERKVVYVQSIGKYGDKGTGESWNKIVTFAKSKRLFGMRTEFIGISHDDPDVTTPEKCRYDACITVTKNVEPDGEVGVKTIEGGKYAIFRLKGPYEKLSDAYRYIYMEWLPRSNVKTRNIPCFEKYLNNPGNAKPAKLLTEIYVPIE
jgi:AraC family transcriptional regulator